MDNWCCLHETILAFQCLMVATGSTSILKSGEVVTEPLGPHYYLATCAVSGIGKNCPQFCLEFMIFLSLIRICENKRWGNGSGLGSIWHPTFIPLSVICDALSFFHFLNWTLLVLGMFPFTLILKSAAAPESFLWVNPRWDWLHLVEEIWIHLARVNVLLQSLLPWVSIPSYQCLIQSQSGDCSLW